MGGVLVTGGDGGGFVDSEAELSMGSASTGAASGTARSSKAVRRGRNPTLTRLDRATRTEEQIQ